MDWPAAFAALAFEPVARGGAEAFVVVDLAAMSFAEGSSGSSFAVSVLDFLVNLADAIGSSSLALRFLDGAGGLSVEGLPAGVLAAAAFVVETFSVDGLGAGFLTPANFGAEALFVGGWAPVDFAEAAFVEAFAGGPCVGGAFEAGGGLGPEALGSEAFTVGGFLPGPLAGAFGAENIGAALPDLAFKLLGAEAATLLFVWPPFGGGATRGGDTGEAVGDFLGGRLLVAGAFSIVSDGSPSGRDSMGDAGRGAVSFLSGRPLAAGTLVVFSAASSSAANILAGASFLIDGFFEWVLVELDVIEGSGANLETAILAERSAWEGALGRLRVS
jgi:hypothetical protein